MTPRIRIRDPQAPVSSVMLAVLEQRNCWVTCVGLSELALPTFRVKGKGSAFIFQI